MVSYAGFNVTVVPLFTPLPTKSSGHTVKPPTPVLTLFPFFLSFTIQGPILLVFKSFTSCEYIYLIACWHWHTSIFGAHFHVYHQTIIGTKSAATLNTFMKRGRFKLSLMPLSKIRIIPFYKSCSGELATQVLPPLSPISQSWTFDLVFPPHHHQRVLLRSCISLPTRHICCSSAFKLNGQTAKRFAVGSKIHLITKTKTLSKVAMWRQCHILIQVKDS